MTKPKPTAPSEDAAPSDASPIEAAPPGGGSWVRQDDGTLTRNKD